MGGESSRVCLQAQRQSEPPFSICKMDSWGSHGELRRSRTWSNLKVSQATPHHVGGHEGTVDLAVARHPCCLIISLSDPGRPLCNNSTGPEESYHCPGPGPQSPTEGRWRGTGCSWTKTGLSKWPLPFLSGQKTTELKRLPRLLRFDFFPAWKETKAKELSRVHWARGRVFRYSCHLCLSGQGLIPDHRARWGLGGPTGALPQAAPGW